MILLESIRLIGLLGVGPIVATRSYFFRISATSFIILILKMIVLLILLPVLVAVAVTVTQLIEHHLLILALKAILWELLLLLLKQHLIWLEWFCYR